MTATTVERAVVRTTSDPTVVVRALRASSLEPRGLGRHTTFFVRQLQDPAPGLLRKDPAAWQDRVVDVLTGLLDRAARPARDGRRGADEDVAVRFDGPAELLAARLEHVATPRRRTWWHGVAGWSTTTVAQLCVEYASEVPHAFACLHATGRLDGVVHSLTEAEAEAVTRALAAVWVNAGRHVWLSPFTPDDGTEPSGLDAPSRAPLTAGTKPTGVSSERRRLVDTASALTALSPSTRVNRLVDIDASESPRTDAWTQPTPRPMPPGPEPTTSRDPGTRLAEDPSTLQPTPLPTCWQSAYAGGFMVLNALVVLGFVREFTHPIEDESGLHPFGIIRAVVERVIDRELAELPDPISAILRPLSEFGEPATADTVAQIVDEVVAWLADAVGPDLDASCVVQRAGEIELVDDRLDVIMPLDALPIEIRLAGLDRDIGWLPAAACHIAFHFTCDELSTVHDTARREGDADDG